MNVLNGWNKYLLAPREVRQLRQVRHRPLNGLEVVAALHGTDIVLAEGFHQAPGLKIEVLSAASGQRRCAEDPHLIATVGSAVRAASVANFEPDAIKPLADFIEREVLGKHGLPGVTKNSKFEIPSVSQLPVG